MTHSRRVSLRLAAAIATFCVAALLMWASGSSPKELFAQAPDPCAVPVTNPVACENTLTGNPASEWDVVGAGSSAIQGFATDISVNRGQTVRFKVETAATAYRLDVYRLGYYGGAGARKIVTVLPSAALPQAQPVCTADNSTGLYDCGTWVESASWAVPATAVSGIYVAKLVRTDGVTGSSHIVFVVRDDTGQSDLLFQTSDTTWQAYNQYGGNSLYVGAPAGRAYKVSYNRPVTTRGTSPADWVFNAEYPMVRWLEANGYNVSYSSGIDTDRLGSQLLQHKVFLSVGHDEYWSGAQRANVEAARAAGVHLAFFSGNEVFWKTRYEPSIDGSSTAYRTLVSYKETHANAKIDPLVNVWTGTWRDPRFSPPADGNRPENRLTGTIFTVNAPGSTSDAIQVPDTFGKLRLWRNTSLATLAAGTTATLAAGTLGYEWDEALANGAQPAGLIRQSAVTINVASKLQDYGSTYAPGTATHAVTLYRYAASNAFVFGAGTVQWSWGLDGVHDRGGSVADVRVQQATVNVLADMAVQPGALQPGLVAATASTDTTAPTSAITAPAAGATVLQGSVTTISGTASDTGGIVGGVEVSVDSGATWAPAAGQTTWTYAWTPTTLGSTTLMARGIDDSGNIGAAASTTVTVATTLPSSCPCSLWPDTTTPPIPDAGADASLELGVKFRADNDGYISGIRFYKSAANTGAHVGNLWTTGGTLLASVVFSGESTSGWQTATFSTSVPVTANTLYVASYHLNSGHYAFAGNYFGTAGVNSGVLHAPATGVSPNGVYRYGAASVFPNQSFNAANYWVDVVYTTTAVDTTPPAVTSMSPSPGATTVDINANVTATFSEAMDVSTINGSSVELRDAANNAVGAVVSYDSVSRTVTLNPDAALAPASTYTAVIRGGTLDPRVKDSAGNVMTANFTWTFSVPGDVTAPTVTSVLPLGSATNVATTTVVKATFSEAMDASTISGSTFTLRTAAATLVPAAVVYDAVTKTATLTPTSSLAASSTYTASVRGGSTDPRAKDLAGNALAADVSWAFTTAAVLPSGCPCSIWSTSVTPAVADGNDPSAVELGVKFTSDNDGYVTGVRFYKAATNTGTHLGHLWTTGGTLLGTVTFAGETTSGWQIATFDTPVAITANTTYVVSYFAPVGRYSYTSSYFTTATNNAPLHALANSASSNGVYRYGASLFPNQSYNSTNYWVDVVYGATAGGSDTTPPSVASVSPVNGASGIGINTSISAVFSEALDPATVSGASIELRDGANALVSTAVSWTAATRTVVVQSSAPLQSATQYTMRIKGGSIDPRVKDIAGNPMATDYSWSFTTGSSVAASPTQGPGGPILVVTASSNPFGVYYAEILRAEGLNEFTVADITAVTAGTLAGYDVVLLSEISLTPAQVTMFTSWVNGGGNLVAMRPDKQLAGLLGLTDLNTTISDKYLLVNTSTSPGLGIVGETMQFHGTADRYTLNGASAVATLYSSVSAATGSPALATRAVAGGGTVAAFTYDLAKSVVYTRQGNPAWAGQNRDGLGVAQTDDLFFGAAAGDPQPDWIDFAKVAIPQADEQQRLLANVILNMNLSKKPLPRFWYLPRGLKAAIVMTGDDHDNGGTAGRFEAYKAASPGGCSVDNWECIRSTSYLYPPDPLKLSDAAASAYTALGFEIALHSTAGCQGFTAASLATAYTQQLAAFASRVPSAGAPKTNRTHCLTWSDFDSQPQVQQSNGIRLDTTYYYWPGTWVLDRPGMFTGSGLPMRFAKANGTILDIYQAPTQMNDEASQTYPATVTALLDKALGSEGYYGAFVANMHTDTVASAGSAAIVSAAQARGVPVISARQLLTWVDARNASSFGALTWSAGASGPQGGRTLTFTVTAATDSTGLQGMLPLRLTGGIGQLTSLQRNGAAVVFNTTTVKGVAYVAFPASAGSYTAIYDTTPPLTTFSATPATLTNSSSATFAFSSNEAGSAFSCNLDGGAFTPCASPQVYTGLPSGSHTLQVRATDVAGNVETSPASHIWTVDTVAPAIASVTPAANATGAALSTSVSVTFSEAMSSVTASTFRLRKVGAASDLAATVVNAGNSATLQPSAPLLLGAAYQATMSGSVTDVAGNALGADAVWTFTVNGAVIDNTVADFNAGSADASTRVTQTTDGEVMLAPADGSEFAGASLPAGWSATPWGTGGTGTVTGGTLTVNGARVNPTAIYGPGRSLEFVATFGTDNYQHVGFGVTMNETPWAIFSTASGGGLYARSHDGASSTDTLIAGAWLNAAHRYRIDWNTSTIVFSIDGVQVASHTRTITASMRPIISDYNTGGSSTTVDWMRLTPYASASTFTSRVFDATATATWASATWTADLPAGTSVVLSVRTGESATPDGTWSAFTAVSAPGGAVNLTGRYAQYRLLLSSTAPGQSPAIRDVTLMGFVQ